MTHLPIKMPTSFMQSILPGLVKDSNLVKGKYDVYKWYILSFPQVFIFLRDVYWVGSYWVGVEDGKGGNICHKSSLILRFLTCHVLSGQTGGLQFCRSGIVFLCTCHSLCLEHLFPNCLLQSFYLSYRLEAFLIYPRLGWELLLCSPENYGYIYKNTITHLPAFCYLPESYLIYITQELA